MRFEPRFNNGAWKLFDMVAYDDVDIFGREIDAKNAAARANANDALRKARGTK